MSTEQEIALEETADVAADEAPETPAEESAPEVETTEEPATEESAEAPAEEEAPAPAPATPEGTPQYTGPAPIEARSLDELPDEIVDFEAAIAHTVLEFNEGDIVIGTVVSVDSDGAMVDIGYKSEGLIPT